MLRAALGTLWRSTVSQTTANNVWCMMCELAEPPTNQQQPEQRRAQRTLNTLIVWITKNAKDSLQFRLISFAAAGSTIFPILFQTIWCHQKQLYVVVVVVAVVITTCSLADSYSGYTDTRMPHTHTHVRGLCRNTQWANNTIDCLRMERAPELRKKWLWWRQRDSEMYVEKYSGSYGCMCACATVNTL